MDPKANEKNTGKKRNTTPAASAAPAPAASAEQSTGEAKPGEASESEAKPGESTGEANTPAPPAWTDPYTGTSFAALCKLRDEKIAAVAESAAAVESIEESIARRALATGKKNPKIEIPGDNGGSFRPRTYHAENNKGRERVILVKIGDSEAVSLD